MSKTDQYVSNLWSDAIKLFGLDRLVYHLNVPATAGSHLIR
jgi:hypothetical protein